MNQTVALQPISPQDRTVFIDVAKQYFTELNPNFVPRPDWEENYFGLLQSSANLYPSWLIAGEQRVGFALYGIEQHLFSNRKHGMIYEFYILPEYRRSGIAQACARRVIRTLNELGAARVQLDVVLGNDTAATFWQKLGFGPVSRRFVLSEPNQ